MRLKIMLYPLVKIMSKFLFSILFLSHLFDVLASSEAPRTYLQTKTIYQGSHRSGNSGKILKTFFPVREIREKQGFFSRNQGKKFQIRELFFQTIFKPFKPINLRKMFFKTVKPQELSGNCNICID